MNEIQQAAFELRIDNLEKIVDSTSDLQGSMLAACSAHDPTPGLQLRVIRFLFDHGACVAEQDKNGVTALHRAVRFRSPAAVEELLKLGADPNATDKRTKSTPLHGAVTNTGAPMTAGRIEDAITFVRLLLSNGADAKKENKNGRSCTDYVRNPRMRAEFAEYFSG
jgi:uncharacterized protein